MYIYCWQRHGNDIHVDSMLGDTCASIQNETAKTRETMNPDVT
jgi:hypothetical protein